MTKELDALLQSIEERGGFRDACTVSQKSKVEELEQGIATLSEKCQMWRVIFRTNDLYLISIIFTDIYISSNVPEFGVVKAIDNLQKFSLF